MNYTQNYKINQVEEETLVVGVDIAKKTHYARAFDWRGLEVSKVKKFNSDKEGFEEFSRWVKEVSKKAEKTKVIVGIEPTGHYWFTFGAYVINKGMQIVQVNPSHVKKAKELDDNNPSKTDKKDPKTIAMLVKDGRYLIPYYPKDKYAELRTGYEMRETHLKNITRIKNRITRWLDIYFPEFRKVFKTWNGKTAIMTLEKHALPIEIIEMSAEEILNEWREEIKRGNVGISRAEELLKAAKDSVGIIEGLEMAKHEIKELIKEYEFFNKQIEETEQRIKEIAITINGIDEIVSIKGIGIITAAGFMAEVGDIKRFNHAKQIIKLAGLNIKENSSGKHKGRTKITKRGRKRLRSLLYKAMLPLVGKNEEFKKLHNYYTTREKNPLKKKQSMIALCVKLIRVIFAIITKNKKYDPVKLLEDIKRPELKIA